nr:U2 small nuclear ribonucleoprotein auxiliary factor 35 kDa subunit-related protein 1-like [Nothobranchius furzeri]
MRCLCKEEDYVFLGTSERTPGHSAEGAVALDDWRHQKEERVRHRLEWEKREEERLTALEESKKEKEQRWRIHVAELTSKQERALQDKLMRLQKFREFQRNFLREEEGMEDGIIGQILMRM